MATNDTNEVKIARLQVEVENVKELVKGLDAKFDRFMQKFEVDTEKWALRTDLEKIESKALKNLWFTNSFTGISASVVTFLLVEYLKRF